MKTRVKGFANSFTYTCDECGQPLPEEERVVFGVARTFPPRRAHTFHYHAQCVPHPLSSLLKREEE